MKNMLISSIILSGGLLIAGQAIGQFQSLDQTLQGEQTERSETEINSTEGSSDTARTRQDDSALEQQSEFFSGTDQQRFRDTDQQRFPERQEEFGVSPRFDNREDFRSRQRQDQREDQLEGFSDTTREQDSPAFQGPGQVQGQGGGNMQSGPGSSGGGFGGQGGQSGSGGQ